MIDVNILVHEELSSELKEFLRMTLPNLGFFGLMENIKLKINQELVNLSTDCSDADFKSKYDKLILERNIYEQLDILARSLNENQTEER